MMRATKFEFEQRFWVISLIFFVGFGLWFVDNTGAAVVVVRPLARLAKMDADRSLLAVRGVLAAGAGLVFLCALLRTWSTAYLRAEIVHDPRQHAEALVADGPYRHVRNPLYLANVLLVAGMGVMASRAGWVFMVAAMWVFSYRLILREEGGLLREQGERYRAYLKAVPRLWPSPMPRVPAGGVRPRWGQAIVGELFFWILGLSVLAFAVTENMRVPGIIIAAGFIVFFAIGHAIRKRTNPASQ